MRGLLLAIVLGALAAPVAAPAKSPRLQQTTIVKAVTGDIAALGPTRITVGRLTCRIGTKAAAVARFVISDPVTIVCRSGSLLAIRYTPNRGANTTASSVTAALSSSSTSADRPPVVTPGTCTTNGDVTRCLIAVSSG